MNKALGDTFLDPDLEYLLVPCLRVSLDILSTGLESEFIGSLQSSCLLETIIRRSIILFNNNKMSAFIQLFQSCQTVITLETYVKLNMRSALLAFLELAVDVGAMLEPLGQVLFGSNVRVV